MLNFHYFKQEILVIGDVIKNVISIFLFLVFVEKFEICIEFVTSSLISTINVTETIQLLAKQEWLFYVEFLKSISISYFWSCYIQVGGFAALLVQV